MSFDATIPHILPELPPKGDFRSEAYVDLLLKTRTELGELKGYAFSLPNPFLLTSPALIRESVDSSSIENINTTVEQVLQQQLFPELEQREPDREVLNYRNAIIWGHDQMQNLPISSRLILGIHKQLLPKASHGFRRTQNRIENSKTGAAVYTPPMANEIGRLLANLEQFIHHEDGIDPLIKCAIAHYQFEAIHPFLDGNGRTGRILMVLHLVQAGLLSMPILYLSAYVNVRKDDYYRLLLGVTTHSQWVPYIRFILDAVKSQSVETKVTLFKVMRLYREYSERIKAEHRKIYNRGLVDHLFSHPIVTPVNLAAQVGCHYTTATRYLMQLSEAGLLEDRFYGKYHLFINRPLLEIISAE